MSTLARVVFALLVAATFGAFFVSQKLKNAESVAEYTKLRHYFSPNGDGVRDRDRISFKVEKADRLTITVVNLDGDRVRRLATGVDARPERPVTVVWDGRSDDGIRAPDGRYRLQVGLRRTGRTVTIPGAFNVDTTAPKPVVVSVKPATAGPVAGAFQIHARRVGSRRAPRFRILRTDLGPPKEVARFLGRKGSQRAEWDGKVNGLPAPPGIYMVVVRVRDKAGNLGTAPAVLPPVPGQVRGKPGITVRALAAQPPVVAVRAGERVAFDVDARDRAYRWDVRRVGGRKVEEGRAAAGKRTLVLRSPRGASGVYLLQVRSGSSRTRVPFLVQSRERSEAARRRPDRLVARRGQDRRRPRRPAQHARQRRPGGVAAGLHAAAARARRRHRAAAHLPRPRGHQVRPHLGHRARPLRRADRRQPTRRDPRRLAAVDPAVARPPPAPLRRVRRARGELRHRVDAPRHADHRRRALAARRRRRRSTRSARASSRSRCRAPRTTAARRCR